MKSTRKEVLDLPRSPRSWPRWRTTARPRKEWGTEGNRERKTSGERRKRQLLGEISGSHRNTHIERVPKRAVDSESL